MPQQNFADEFCGFLRLHDEVRPQLSFTIPTVGTVNFNFIPKCSLIGNQALRIINKEYEIITLRLLAIQLYVVMEFLRDFAAVCFVADVFGVYYKSSRRRKEVLDCVSVPRLVAWGFVYKIHDPWP